MNIYDFKNFEMFDPEDGDLRGGHELVVEGDLIREVSAKPIKLANANVIDCGGRTLMPGLIDSHVHVVLPALSVMRSGSIKHAFIPNRSS